MFPTGVVVDCFAVLAGGMIGSLIKNKIPARLQAPLTVMFGFCAILIGVVSFIKLHSLPAVILSLILGTLVGEVIDIDTRIKKVLKRTLDKLHFKIEGDSERYMNFYVLVTATLCFSGTNIFGAINESITGDMTILLSKAVMDVFAGAIFATTLGYAMNLIVIPQAIILSALFYAAKFLMGFTTETMLLDFTAVGGVITFIIGISIAEIKRISAINILPSLVLIFPISYLFSLV